MKYILILLIPLMFLGCKTVEVKSYKNITVEGVSPINAEIIKSAIKKASYLRGWTFKEIKKGELELTYGKSRRFLTLQIFYSNTDYSIHYKDSAGLKYNSETQTIHKKYAQWIKNLRNDILRSF